LALPLIHKKISSGKLSLKILGMRENDVVFDCIADLFTRDDKGRLTLVNNYFDNVCPNFDELSDEFVLTKLRQLIFTKVHNNIIRLYNEADPALGKILRNLRIALNKNNYFNQITRFGDVYLIPIETEVLWHKPPLTIDYLHQAFIGSTSIDDNMPEMLKKLYDFITEQEEFQKAIPFVNAALVLKEVFVLAWKVEQIENNSYEIEVGNSDIKNLANEIVRKIRIKFHASYVDKEKLNEDEFCNLLNAIELILIDAYSTGGKSAKSYFEYLKDQRIHLTKEEYNSYYRTIMEYLTKIAKERMKEELVK
jgi:hypothetical protein